MLEKIDEKNNLPNHLAIIMDGNGRWAEQKGKIRSFGHYNAVNAVYEAIDTSAKLGIKYLTLFAFSTENWNRPKSEVNTLMKLFRNTIEKNVSKIHKNNIKLNIIGVIEDFPEDIQEKVNKIILKTENNTGMTLTIALSYSGREEIRNMVINIAEKVKKNIIKINTINDSLIKKHLYTRNLPELDLLIRTSGEQRISNFLLWQIAYTELYFTEVLWPDFSKKHLMASIEEYQKRERRFGQTSRQTKKK